MWGWIVQNPLLIRGFFDSVPMQFNTALGLCIGALGLLAYALQWRKLAYFLSSLLFLEGSLILVEYIGNLDLKIDTLFIFPFDKDYTIYPGRPAPNTALCLVFLGASLFAGLKQTKLFALELHRFSYNILYIFSFIALVGYIIGVSSSYAWGKYTHMALHTALCFLLLSIGLNTLSWREHSFDLSEKITLILGTFLAFTLLTFLSNHEEFLLKQQFQYDSEDRFNEIEQQFSLDAQILHAFEGFYRGSQFVDRQEFEDFALYATKDVKNILSIDWIARVSFSERESFEKKQKKEIPEFYIKELGNTKKQFKPAQKREYYYPIVYSFPTQENRFALGFDHGSDLPRQQVLEQLLNHKEMEATSPIHLFRVDSEQDQGILLIKPIFKEDKLEGYLSTVISIDLFMNNVLSNVSAQNLYIDLYDVTHNEKNPLYSEERKREIELKKIFVSEKRIQFAGRDYLIVCTAGLQYIYSIQSFMPWAVFIFFILMTLAISYFLLRLQREKFQLIKEMSDRKKAQKLAETAAQELEKVASLRQAILNGGNYSIISTNREGIIQSFNAAAERMLGYTAEEMVGIKTPEIIHDYNEVLTHAQELSRELKEEIKPGFEVFVAKAKRGGSEEREWTYIRKNGSRFPVLLSVTPILDLRRKITGFLGIGSDITERKKSENIKNEFISVVSHELRTPLTSIRGALGLIAGGKGGEISKETKPLINIALRNCEHLIGLVNDILDLSKIESGKMEYNLETLLLYPLLEESIKNNQAFADKYEVSLQIKNHTSSPIYVSADSRRVLQVVTNFISNAVKFSPPKSTVSVELKIKENKAHVAVIDQGAGIPEEFYPKIFKKFNQAASANTRARGGTGLGLAISKSIIESMGGEIGFRSTLGEGSTFFFELPLVKPENS